MPEGPEIRIEVDRVGGAIEGRKARSVFFGLKRLKRFEPVLEGSKVNSVRARGKAILIRFGNGLTLYSHNQLYGRWVVCDDGALPETGRQLRVAIEVTRRRALLYSASEIQVLDADALERHPYLSALGPDILNERVSAAQIRSRLELPRFRRRSMASLFLDKSFLAGIGNYLRSEILFHARVHPARRPESLPGPELARLSNSARRIVMRSYRTRGVTNDADRVRMLKARGFSRSEFRFAVFSREGEACPRCGARIVRRQISGRRCYFCPDCQPL